MNLLVALMFAAIAVSACSSGQSGRGLLELHQRQVRSADSYTLSFSLRTMESGLCSRPEAVSVDLSYRIITSTEWITLRSPLDIVPSEEKMVEVPVTAGSAQFQWLQNNHRGGCFECWVIDAVTITVPGEISHPQPISFVDYSYLCKSHFDPDSLLGERCDDTIMNSISLCGGSASVPRGALAVYNSAQERSELPCDIFQPLEDSGIQRCQSCPLKSLEKAFLQVNFQLFIGNGDIMFDEIESFDEGVEFAVRRIGDNQWIPLNFFTNTGKEQSRSINIGNYDRVSNTLSLRGYNVSVTNVPNEVLAVHECICYSPSSLNQVQLRWLQTTQHRARSNHIVVPRDTWYIDNVEMSATNESCNQIIFNDSFRSRNIHQTMWPEIRGGKIENLLDVNEMMLYFGDSDDLTTDDPSIDITTSRLAVTEIIVPSFPFRSHITSQPWRLGFAWLGYKATFYRWYRQQYLGLRACLQNSDDLDYGDLVTRAEQIGTEAEAFAIVDDLISLTQSGLSQNFSQFAENFNAIVSVLNAATDFLSKQIPLSDANETVRLVDVLNNVLNETNLDGFQMLQMNGSTQSLLETAERIGVYMARAVDNDDNISELNISRENIVVQAVIASPEDDVEVVFTASLETFDDSNGIPAHITIPVEYIAVMSGNVSHIPVVSMLFRNMECILPNSLQNGTRPRSVVVSSQVVVERGVDQQSDDAQAVPIQLNFTVQLKQTDENPRCAFWNHLDNEGWSIGGVSTENLIIDGEIAVVQCSSTHLTSFAVLVNVGGAIDVIDSLALNVVSYIGSGVSLACLLLTIIFFLGFGKRTVQNFIHLNLAIALFLGYLTFAVGTELAVKDEVACKVVAALLHYLFLASFCWMLCEGIMLYLMLVVVFSSLSKRWWLFLVLGWSLPLPFVAIGLGVSLEEYGVRDEEGNLQICWLSNSKGANAIWTFVAPMLAVILVNAIILIVVLVSISRSSGTRKMQMMKKGKRIDLAISLTKASVILLPLLGLTWVFGLFAVNKQTVVFAWLFTIFNSLQGLFIFIFHVIRSNKVWGGIKRYYKKLNSKGETTINSMLSRERNLTTTCVFRGPGAKPKLQRRGTETILLRDPIEKQPRLHEASAVIFTESTAVPGIDPGKDARLGKK